ncbi:bifunctional tetrahydrofolate synthase/dihydrofolate synthase [Marinobacter oulmenensis]|nr:bifunctional tetrahydrofolate synthase/dihydrofolate synthase [Marinobacter oulmenensis]
MPMNPKSSDATPAPAKAPLAGAPVNDWLNYLEAIHPTEIDLGLDRVLVVLRRLFPTRPRSRIITVAGTNGKGSTVAALERLLQASGRTTGAYTSPHLDRYNERVRINGADIPDDSLVRAFEAVESARGSVSLTYFEFGTLAAFVALAEAGVEDWILEVGLGGRLDAVNVLDADFAIITSIDIDHVGFLGDNREVIGYEKAGILRPGIDAVCADPQPPASVMQQAGAQAVRLRLTGRDYQLTRQGAGTMSLSLGDETIELPDGPLPLESLAAAVVACRHLAPALSPSQITGVVEMLELAGRFETLRKQPLTLVDVGHNPHAARWLADRLARKRQPGGRVYGIYGALADKDVEGVVAAMAPVVDHWYLAGLAVPRGLSASGLGERVAGAGVDGFETSTTVAEALEGALAAASPDDIIIAFGSFFTVSQARAASLTAC